MVLIDSIDVKDDLLDEHRAGVPEMKQTKRGETKDLLTIFSDRLYVKFVKHDGTVEEIPGRWCNICK